MGVPSKNSSVLDMGRRPELKSDEFFEGTPLSSRDNCTFVLETAQESGSVIGGATRAWHDARCFAPPNFLRRKGPSQRAMVAGSRIWAALQNTILASVGLSSPQNLVYRYQ